MLQGLLALGLLLLLVAGALLSVFAGLSSGIVSPVLAYGARMDPNAASLRAATQSPRRVWMLRVGLLMLAAGFIGTAWLNLLH